MRNDLGQYNAQATFVRSLQYSSVTTMAVKPPKTVKRRIVAVETTAESGILLIRLGAVTQFDILSD